MLLSHGFVRRAGQRSSLVLGTGNAVFIGGVVGRDASGRTEVLVGPQARWLWPAIFGGLAALLLPIFWFAMDGLARLILAAVIALGLMALALGAYVLARVAGRRSLLVDGSTRTLRELDRGRDAGVAIPASTLGEVVLQTFVCSDRIRYFDVLVTCGPDELWLHQSSDEPAARALAARAAALLGIPCAAEMRRID